MYDQLLEKAEKDKNIKQDEMLRGGLSIPSVMMSYGYRLSKDKARVKIKEAMEVPGEGKKPLIVPFKNAKGKKNKKPSGFVKLSSRARHGILADHYMDPIALETWENVRIVDEKQAWYDKSLALTKLWQFANPFFLGVYDVYQHIMSGTLMMGALRPIRTVTNLGRAIKGAITHDANMQEAQANNTFSKPYDYPYSDMLDKIEILNKMTASKLKNAFIIPAMHTWQALHQKGTVLSKGGLANPLNYILATYKGLFTMAWKLDEIVRLYTYLQMRDQKFLKMTPQQAGEAASLFHADYASNFKVSMAKLYGNMLASVWRVPRDFVTPGKNVDPVQFRYLMGFFGTIAVNYAFDVMMKSLGYFPDDEDGLGIVNLGRRYIKHAKDRFGPSDITFTWSNPANMPQRYLQRLLGREGSLLKAMRWDLHPVWNLVQPKG
jgi:hypothetical protein